MEWDIFISHASEDKATVVLPLAAALRQRDVRVWYDEWVLTIGDSLREKIDEGLARSAFGALILSRSFFNLSKMWPRAELDGLMQKEIGGRKAILPVWHGVTADEVRAYSLMLAGRRACSTAIGIDVLADELVRAMGIGTPLLTKGLSASPETGIRLGRVALSDIYIETDPQAYVG